MFILIRNDNGVEVAPLDRPDYSSATRGAPFSHESVREVENLIFDLSFDQRNIFLKRLELIMASENRRFPW